MSFGELQSLREACHRVPVVDVERGRLHDCGHRSAAVDQAPLVSVSLKFGPAQNQKREGLDDWNLTLKAPSNARFKRCECLQGEAKDERHFMTNAERTHLGKHRVDALDLVGPMDRATLVCMNRLKSKLQADVEGGGDIEEIATDGFRTTLKR